MLLILLMGLPSLLQASSWIDPHNQLLTEFHLCLPLQLWQWTTKIMRSIISSRAWSASLGGYDWVPQIFLQRLTTSQFWKTSLTHFWTSLNHRQSYLHTSISPRISIHGQRQEWLCSCRKRAADHGLGTKCMEQVKKVGRKLNSVHRKHQVHGVFQHLVMGTPNLNLLGFL